jgi:hypothetical protein
MNIAITNADVMTLPALVSRAAAQLASATNAAEVLQGEQMADVAYDASKVAARLLRAKGAHDELVAKALRAQGDALDIKSAAARRLADEYDAAQERGEVAGEGFKGNQWSVLDENAPATAADIGLSRKHIHEARMIRDAEVAEPGIARRVINERLAQGLEPTKAALREAVVEAARQGVRGGGGGSQTQARNPLYEPPSRAGAAWSHVYGTCRSFDEWATDENVRLAIIGMRERRDDQSRNIAAVRRALEALTNLERMLNAQ